MRAARAQGVRRFQAYVLAGNVDTLRLLRGIGELRTSWAGPAVHVTVDLPEPAGAFAVPRADVVDALAS